MNIGVGEIPHLQKDAKCAVWIRNKYLRLWVQPLLLCFEPKETKTEIEEFCWQWTNWRHRATVDGRRIGRSVMLQTLFTSRLRCFPESFETLVVCGGDVRRAGACGSCVASCNCPFENSRLDFVPRLVIILLSILFQSLIHETLWRSFVVMLSLPALLWWRLEL